MPPQTREWVKKAEGDIRAAIELARVDRMHDQVCFHCQQAAEKYLKALMEEQGLVVPKTHDLEILLGHLSSAVPALLPLKRGLMILVDYAVDTRYPGNQTPSALPPGYSRRHKLLEPSTSKVPANLLHAAASAAGAAGAGVADASPGVTAAAVTAAAAGSLATASRAGRS